MTNSKEFKEYVCKYRHDGSWWCLNIHAKNDEDARARVANLGNLKLLGELGGTIPACLPGAGFLVRLIVTFKNMMCGLRSNDQAEPSLPESGEALNKKKI